MSGLPKIDVKITDFISVGNIKNNSKIEHHFIFFDKISSERNRQIKHVNFHECIFSYEQIKHLDFQKCHFENCLFNGSQIYSCEFHKCTFSEYSFYKATITSTYLNPRSFKYSRKWYIKWSNVNTWWFQALYRNSKDMHQEKFAMHADNKFHFYLRYQYLFGKEKRRLKFLKGLIYDITLGNGYGIWNSLVLTVIFILMFAFAINGQISTKNAGNVIESLYFAIVSFTTVGYGCPSGKHVYPAFFRNESSLKTKFIAATTSLQSVVLIIPRQPFGRVFE